MAPSRAAISMTWSVGTNRNSASLSTNILMSQGQATRSTLTRSRVIHFMLVVLLLSCFYKVMSHEKDTGIQVLSGGCAAELRKERIVDQRTSFQSHLIIRADEADTL